MHWKICWRNRKTINREEDERSITFVPRSFRIYESSNLKYVNLVQDKFYTDMMLAYSETRLSRAGKEFVRLCENWDFQPSGSGAEQILVEKIREGNQKR